jgi:hypothetical protein
MNRNEEEEERRCEEEESLSAKLKVAKARDCLLVDLVW